MIDTYYEDVRKLGRTLLTAEEERTLATRARAGDRSAAHTLVTRNLRLVFKIVKEMCRVDSMHEDFIQEGNLGLMKAVEKFDPSRGVRFSTYAGIWIRAYLCNAMTRRSIVNGTTTAAQRKMFFNLRKAEGDDEKLAKTFGVSASDVSNMRGWLSGDVSDVGARISNLRSAFEGQDEQLERAQTSSLVRRRLVELEPKLNHKQRRVLHERILADEPATLDEIGQTEGVSKERIRQIDAKLRATLRECLGSVAV